MLPRKVFWLFPRTCWFVWINVWERVCAFVRCGWKTVDLAKGSLRLIHNRFSRTLVLHASNMGENCWLGLDGERQENEMWGINLLEDGFSLPVWDPSPISMSRFRAIIIYEVESFSWRFLVYKDRHNEAFKVDKLDEIIEFSILTYCFKYHLRRNTKQHSSQSRYCRNAPKNLPTTMRCLIWSGIQIAHIHAFPCVLDSQSMSDA